MKKYASVENIRRKLRATHQLRVASRSSKYSWRQKIALRIAALSLEKESDTLMDQVARLQFLEGVYGMTPGIWSRNLEKGFEEAAKHVSTLFVEVLDWGRTQEDVDEEVVEGQLHELWLSKYDTGLYRVPRNAAQRILEGSMGMEGNDIMQNLMTGVSYDRQGEPTMRSETMYYGIGQNAGNRGFDETSTPSDYTGVAQSYAAKQAINVKAKQQTEQGLAQKRVDLDPDPLVSGERSALSFWLDLMTNRSDSHIQVVWDLFLNAWRSKGYWPIVEAVLRATANHSIAAEGGWASIAQDLEVAPSVVRAAVGRAAKDARKALMAEIKANPSGTIARALVRVDEIISIESSLGLGRIISIVKQPPRSNIYTWRDIVSRFKGDRNDRKILLSVWSKMKNWSALQVVLSRFDGQGRPLDAEGRPFQGRGFWSGLAAELGTTPPRIRAVVGQAKKQGIKVLTNSGQKQAQQSVAPPF